MVIMSCSAIISRTLSIAPLDDLDITGNWHSIGNCCKPMPGHLSALANDAKLLNASSFTRFFSDSELYTCFKVFFIMFSMFLSS
jgi:hypothetical protein